MDAQLERGVQDQGTRGSATGGKHLDGFLDLLADLLLDAGVPKEHIYLRGKRDLPGYFRPIKEWDLLVVADGRLITAMEAKSQVGSFGNNFNNRSEEAIGNAVDIWTAFREGALGPSPPWVGYLMLIEDNSKSRRPVSLKEPHFPVDQVFVGASYAQRYELLCRRLVRERHYSASTLMLAAKEQAAVGGYVEPAADLTMAALANSMVAHAKGAFGLI
jgi:hypothetical protein